MNIHDLNALKQEIPGYGELRVHENTQELIRMTAGNLVSNTAVQTGGVSARVCRDGSWGMASSPLKTQDDLRAVLKAAGENAAFLASRVPKEQLALPGRPGTGHHDFHTKESRVTPKDKLDFIRALDDYMLSRYPDLLSRFILFRGFHQEKWLVTGDGTQSYFYVPRTHIYFGMTVDKDGTPIDLMARTIGGLGEFEDFFGDPKRLYGEMDALYETVMKKREGKFAEAGLKECILAPDLAGILAHEAVGHTVESDLVQAGSVAADLLGKQVAAECISMVDYAHHAFGEICPVPVFIDDEGVAAEDAVLIEGGILKGYMHNRQTAQKYGVPPTGNARAFAFNDEPLVRMRNTCILPGKSKLEDMIASVQDGYYLSHPNNGQADTTGEFMFGVTMGYEIKNGKLGAAILDTTVTGVAFEMLKSVTAVSDDLEWVSSGFCGKKQPASVGMGGPAIQCKINVGGV